jgi:hypothetical protein
MNAFSTFSPVNADTSKKSIKNEDAICSPSSVDTCLKSFKSFLLPIINLLISFNPYLNK